MEESEGGEGEKTGEEKGVRQGKAANNRVGRLLYAAWVRSRAERPSVSYTKVVMEVAWTGHNLQNKKTN